MLRPDIMKQHLTKNILARFRMAHLSLVFLLRKDQLLSSPLRCENASCLAIIGYSLFQRKLAYLLTHDCRDKLMSRAHNPRSIRWCSRFTLSAHRCIHLCICLIYQRLMSRTASGNVCMERRGCGTRGAAIQLRCVRHINRPVQYKDKSYQR